MADPQEAIRQYSNQFAEISKASTVTVTRNWPEPFSPVSCGPEPGRPSEEGAI